MWKKAQSVRVFASKTALKLLGRELTNAFGSTDRTGSDVFDLYQTAPLTNYRMCDPRPLELSGSNSCRNERLIKAALYSRWSARLIGASIPNERMRVISMVSPSMTETCPIRSSANALVIDARISATRYGYAARIIEAVGPCWRRPQPTLHSTATW